MGVSASVPRERERPRIDPATVGLLLVVAAAAALRFATIADQSYWYDEALTVELVRSSFGGMLAGVHAHEGEPPLYFMLAWGWTRVFGYGEAGLRSLSALLGVLTVPVAFAAARTLVGLRTAIVTAALVA